MLHACICLICWQCVFCTATQVGIHITHNGDFEAMEAFGTMVGDSPIVVLLKYVIKYMKSSQIAIVYSSVHTRCCVRCCCYCCSSCSLAAGADSVIPLCQHCVYWRTDVTLLIAGY
jgi:hypothetical protein